MHSRPVIDSHSTMSKIDRHRVDEILNRNINLYHNYAFNELNALKTISNQSLNKTTRNGFMSVNN